MVFIVFLNTKLKNMQTQKPVAETRGVFPSTPMMRLPEKCVAENVTR